jgi:hypothetical protein
MADGWLPKATNCLPGRLQGLRLPGLRDRSNKGITKKKSTSYKIRIKRRNIVINIRIRAANLIEI